MGISQDFLMGPVRYVSVGRHGVQARQSTIRLDDRKARNGTTIPPRRKTAAPGRVAACSAPPAPAGRAGPNDSTVAEVVNPTSCRHPWTSPQMTTDPIRVSGMLRYGLRVSPAGSTPCRKPK
jgi:hypothetical protein